MKLNVSSYKYSKIKIKNTELQRLLQFSKSHFMIPTGKNK